MTNASDFKASLQRELDALGRVRDELRVQLHLAKADARDEWSKLEAAYDRLSGELTQASSQLEQPVHELGAAAKGVLEELKQGYARMRRHFPS